MTTKKANTSKKTTDKKTTSNEEATPAKRAYDPEAAKARRDEKKAHHVKIIVAQSKKDTLLREIAEFAMDYSGTDLAADINKLRVEVQEADKLIAELKATEPVAGIPRGFTKDNSGDFTSAFEYDGLTIRGDIRTTADELGKFKWAANYGNDEWRDFVSGEAVSLNHAVSACRAVMNVAKRIK